MQHKQLIEHQKKRRIYNFHHTLFSNIYKRTNRLSSIDSHMFINSTQNCERHARHSNQINKELDITDQHTTSDKVYSQALEEHIPDLEQGRNRIYQATQDGEIRLISNNASSSRRLSAGDKALDSQVENKSQQQSMTRFSVVANNRTKKLPFVSVQQRISHRPAETSNILMEDQKKKRDVIWSLKRSFSFDTPFHRESIEALNKGMFKSRVRKKKRRIRYTAYRVICHIYLTGNETVKQSSKFLCSEQRFVRIDTKLF